MRASVIEFRLRFLVMTAIVALGFWAPWIESFGVGQRISLLEWLALELSRLGLARFSVTSPIVIVTAAVLAACAVALRIWGTAFLGPATVNSQEMLAGEIIAGGPYRHVRNPLYLGSWCMFAAMAFIMPPAGALFSMVLLTVFLLRLILAEEAFLTRQMGESYQAYLHAVPRLLPCLRTTLVAAGTRPRWLHALLSELLPVGVLFTLAVLSWSYNNLLMTKGILVSLGVSLIVRALMPGAPWASRPSGSIQAS
jgi:protein-S-isoprenylcysteine O-methyltransferase Ste14